MGAQDNVGSEVPFAQLIFDSDLFGRELTEDEQREGVDIAASGFAAIFEAAAHAFVSSKWQGHEVDFSVFRCRGVRRGQGETPLSSGDLWGVQMFLRAKPVQ